MFRNYNEIASTMEIYLQDDITEEQIENIKNRIIEKSDKIELEYISKEKALERMKDTFADNPDLLSGYNNENNPMPASIEIKTNTEIQKIVDSIQDMPGITKIETHINYNPYQLFIFNFDATAVVILFSSILAFLLTGLLFSPNPISYLLI